MSPAELALKLMEIGGDEYFVDGCEVNVLGRGEITRIELDKSSMTVNLIGVED